MTYEPEHKHAARSRTVLVNAVVASAAILALLEEHGAALQIPKNWLARISFAGAVLTILLRRFTYARPIRFRRRSVRANAPLATDEQDEAEPLFVGS
jgi:hypothetical protein